MKHHIMLINILCIVLLVSVHGKTQVTDLYQKLNYNNFREYPAFNDSINFSNINYPLLNAAIFFTTNEIRIKYGRLALRYHPALEACAQMHSTDMANNKYLSHYNQKVSEKKTPNDRAVFHGITNPYLAENIAEEFGLQYSAGKEVYTPAKGVFSYRPGGKPIKPHSYLSIAEALLSAWMHSPPHRKNILSKDALQLGCGSFLHINNNFNYMPSFKATQNFQLYEQVIIK